MSRASGGSLPSGERVEVPDVSYTRSGDVSIAYQVVGEGPTDLVAVSVPLQPLHALAGAEVRRVRLPAGGGEAAHRRQRARRRALGSSARLHDRVADGRPARGHGHGRERATGAARHRRGRCDVRRLRCVEPRPRGAADPLRPLVAEHARRTRARGGAGQPSCATRALGPPRCAGAVRRRAQPAVGERSRLPRLVRLAPPAHVEPFLVGRLQAHANRPRRRATRCPRSGSRRL